MTEQAAYEDLKRALAAEEGGRKWIVRLAIAVGLVALITGGLVVRSKNRPPPAAKYLVKEVKRGDVVEKVQATGAVQPVLSVNVGAQANGRVTNVLVDFNSVVKKGDVLAEIDPTSYGAQVSQSEAQNAAQLASVQSAKATAENARIAYERAQKLFAQNLASKAELDTAKGNYDVAVAQANATNAQLGAVRAQLLQAKTNQSFTKIFSPVDGVVITRSIDPGATVQASFQTPTLFVIAQDLKKMRVLADVDEADVGKLREGMQADATVDAFPGETFKGTVQQVRLSPTTTSGVVTYAAVVEVENPEEKLRPGMTATVTVRTHEAKAALLVPNAALRFKPTPTGDEKPKNDTPKGKQRVFIVADATPGAEKVNPVYVTASVTDGTSTAVEGIDEGAQVVVDENEEAVDKKAAGSGQKKGRPF